MSWRICGVRRKEHVIYTELWAVTLRVKDGIRTQGLIDEGSNLCSSTNGKLCLLKVAPRGIEPQIIGEKGTEGSNTSSSVKLIFSIENKKGVEKMG